jgi:hypothetical protein
MSEEQTPCVPAVMKQARGGKQIGDPCSRRAGMRQAREELTRREGTPPFPGAICRHLPGCDNDSMAPNGFVCTLHTTWGTPLENVRDQGEAGIQARKRNGRISSAQPDNAINLQVTCPHCGKAGQKRIMARWHFDNCPHKP